MQKYKITIQDKSDIKSRIKKMLVSDNEKNQALEIIENNVFTSDELKEICIELNKEQEKFNFTPFKNSVIRSRT